MTSTYQDAGTVSQNVFIIDDSEWDRRLFREALKRISHTYTCTEASSGISALNLLSDESYVPNFIFLDLNMPVLGGMEVLAGLQKIDRLKDVPIILCTMSDCQKDIALAEKSSIAHFVTKSVNFSHFVETVRYVLTGMHSLPEPHLLVHTF